MCVFSLLICSVLCNWPPKRVLGQESAIFWDIQISVHWVYLEARGGQLYSGGSDWHLSIPSSLFPPCNILYFHSMLANSNVVIFYRGWKKTHKGGHNIFLAHLATPRSALKATFFQYLAISGVSKFPADWGTYFDSTKCWQVRGSNLRVYFMVSKHTGVVTPVVFFRGS